jgi:hypothetical protein
MRVIISILFFSLIISYHGNSQNLETNDTRLKFTAFTSIGRSIIISDPSAPSKFPALELRIGGGIIKPIGRNIELRSRLAFGIKFKREPFNVDGQPYLIGPPFYALDELSSNRNYCFIEIPLTIQANLPHPKLGLSFGLNYRHFLAYDEPDSHSPYSPNRHEVGIIPGITYRANNKLHIGLDYYFGLTKTYSTGGLIDNQEFMMDAVNQFVQVRFDYIFHNKK